MDDSRSQKSPESVLLLLMSLLYNISVQLYLLGIKAAAPFNEKAKAWIEGRKNIFSELEKAIDKQDSVIWFHVASLGEFEQAKPVIESVKEEFPSHKVLLTFFSPSGYEIRKSYEKADYVFYLPLDSKRNAKKFISIVNPKLAVFIKYEFWFNYINELYKNKIPLLMISVIFRPSQHFFKFWGGWFRKQLRKVTWFYVQNNDSLKLLNKANIYHADKSGDTRFDRVHELVNENRTISEIEQFKNNDILVVAGSSWPPDEDILKYVLTKSKNNFKLVIAPHVVSRSHVEELKRKFKAFNPVLFTEFNETHTPSSRVLILNTTGMLSYVYRYAAFSYIGGGFGVSIHNLLEPVTYGQPVVFGPRFEKFQEAHDLIKAGSGFTINNKDEALTIFNKLLTDKDLLQKASATSKEYVNENIGATYMVIGKIKEFIVEPYVQGKL